MDRLSILFAACLIGFACAKISIEPISKDRYAYGYAPWWNSDDQKLTFTDFEHVPKSVMQYDPKTKKTNKASIQGGVSNAAFFIPVQGEKDKYDMGIMNGVARMTWNGISPEVKFDRMIASPNPDDTNRADLARPDKDGRLMMGFNRVDDCAKTSDPNAAVYLISGKGKFKKQISNTKSSVGMVWSKDGTKYYFADSCNPVINEYTVNPQTGEISKPKPVYKFPSKAKPSGMEITEDGKLLIGDYTAKKIIVVDPKTKKVVRTIKLPIKTVTGMCFGGPKMDELYITSSKQNLQLNKPYTEDISDAEEPLAGATVRVTGLDLKGFPRKGTKKDL